METTETIKKEKELNEWWAKLTQVQKEEVAKEFHAENWSYPACSEWWNNLPLETKENIKDLDYIFGK